MKTEYQKLSENVIILFNRSWKYYYLRDFANGAYSGPYQTSAQAAQAYRDGTVRWKAAGTMTVREFFDMFPFGTMFFAARAGLKYHSTLSNWATGVSTPKNAADIIALQRAIRQTALEMLKIELLQTTKKKAK